MFRKRPLWHIRIRAERNVNWEYGRTNISHRLRRLNFGFGNSTKPLLDQFNAGVFILSRNLSFVFFTLAVEVVGGTTFETKASRRIGPDERMVVERIRFIFSFIEVLLSGEINNSKPRALICFRVGFLWNKT